MPTIAYVRVSTDDQTTDNQKLAILEYSNQEGIRIDEWIEFNGSSRKSTKERRIDELLQRLNSGDTVITSELSRLGRSVGQIVTLIDQLVKSGVKLICLKENIKLNGKPDIQTKTMITMISLFAEIERDLISERTKEGLARAKASGKQLGRPKGSGKSKLDDYKLEIEGLLKLGLPKTKIAEKYGVHISTFNHWMKKNQA